jgi:hypothetical protein
MMAVVAEWISIGSLKDEHGTEDVPRIRSTGSTVLGQAFLVGHFLEMALRQDPPLDVRMTTLTEKTVGIVPAEANVLWFANEGRMEKSATEVQWLFICPAR